MSHPEGMLNALATPEEPIELSVVPGYIWPANGFRLLGTWEEGSVPVGEICTEFDVSEDVVVGPWLA